MVQEAAGGASGVARAARPRVTLAVIADLRKRFGLQDLEPGTEMTMTDDRMVLF